MIEKNRSRQSDVVFVRSPLGAAIEVVRDKKEEIAVAIYDKASKSLVLIQTHEGKLTVPAMVQRGGERDNETIEKLLRSKGISTSGLDLDFLGIYGEVGAFRKSYIGVVKDMEQFMEGSLEIFNNPVYARFVKVSKEELAAKVQEGKLDRHALNYLRASLPQMESVGIIQQNEWPDLSTMLRRS